MPLSFGVRRETCDSGKGLGARQAEVFDGHYFSFGGATVVGEEGALM